MKKSAATRLGILQKAFELIYANGYQATSIDQIIATTQVTKGAFFYHFKSKDEMGISIINEVVKPAAINFIEPLKKEADSLDGIYNFIHNLLLKNDFLKVEYGCPVGNLAQEMTPWNAEFNKAMNDITGLWTKAMIASIEKGKKNGLIHEDINAKQVTLFVVSGYWGIRNFGKLDNSKKVYLPYLKELKNYLNTLK